MVVFHVFIKIVQMLPYRAKYHIFKSPLLLRSRKNTDQNISKNYKFLPVKNIQESEHIPWNNARWQFVLVHYMNELTETNETGKQLYS